MNAHGMIYLFIGLFFMASCKDKATTEEVPLIESNKDSTATPVKTALCREGFFEYRIEANGIIKAEKEIKIYADPGGLITYCLAKNGISVHAGQTLTQYDTTDLALKLDRAEIVRFNASKEYESQLLSYEKLMSDQSELGKKEIKKKLYVSSGFALADQDIKELKHNIHKSIFAAPFSGILADIKIIKGQTVRSGEELMTLLSKDQMLECTVLESDLSMIHIGQTAAIIEVAHPEIKIKGIVTEINPIIESSGMAKVSIHIPNSIAYAGMHARAIIKVPARKSLLVPKEAVVIRGDRSVVFTIIDHIAKWNYVTVGRNNGVDIEIMNGLQNGDKVILSNNLQLAHEAMVKEEGKD